MRIHHYTARMALSALLSLSALAHAQFSHAPAPAANPAAPDLALTFNSVMANAGPGQCGCFRMTGGSAEFGKSFSPSWGIVADVAGSTTSSVNQSTIGLSLITYTVGARYTPRVGRTRFFVQGLAGGSRGFASYFPNAANTSSAKGLALLAGGGIDVDVKGRFAVRALQVDYLYTDLPNSTSNHQNILRLGVGVLFHLPAKSDVH